MPLNLLKKYPQLLELSHLNEGKRKESLKGVFRRDIEENQKFNFREKKIRPIKKEGQASMDTLFHHLITRIEKNEKGKQIGRRFEIDRSRRLHWIKHHIKERKVNNMDVFSYEDRILGRGDVIRTYIFDLDENYIIILEPQKSKLDYYLITAYYLNQPQGKKQIMKKRKKKLGEIY